METQLDEVTIGGKRYISVKRAGALCDYTTDYVAQLCRGGKIDATRVGRNWYVNESSIIEHKSTQSEKPSYFSSIQGENIARLQKPGFFKSSFIMYYPDDRPLIPPLQTPIMEDRITEIEETSTISEEIVDYTPKIEEQTQAEPAFYRATSPSRWFAIPKIAFASAAFLIVFMAFFSLNGAYTGSLISDGVAAVAQTPFAQTSYTELVQPYEHVAVTINELVDEAIYTHLIAPE